MLLDPSAVKLELAYYQHGVDRITFTIEGLEYNIPGSLPKLPTLYFVGFNRVAASEIFAKFQTTKFDESSLSAIDKFTLIILCHLRQQVCNCCGTVFIYRLALGYTLRDA